MVNVNQRNYAHSNKIYSWKHHNCSSESLNIRGKKIAPIVDKFITINRSKSFKLKNIINNSYNWKTQYPLDFYIDFETINETFMKDSMNIANSQSNSDVCFRISVGYDSNNKYESVAFTMKHFSLEEEKSIFEQFKNFIESRVKDYMKKNSIKNRKLVKPKLFHWAIAEQNFMKHANGRHNGFLNDWLIENNIVFVDMCNIFIQEPIIIKGMFNFKLKEVAKAMYEHGMIQTKWEADIPNGLVAMMGATKYYKNTSDESNKKLMEKIAKYNDSDVKVLWEIVRYLRTRGFSP
jgi:hypothetical protein